jgi:5-methylcytosine-specific restriction endonuclease McrA
MIAETKKRCWVCNAVITWSQSDTACKLHCRSVLYTESYRIARHKEESYRKGRSCNLQLSEWAETLRYYNRCCAYCKGPFESLDHFMPVSQGGGTWVGNVVPACLQCQTAKGSQLPREVEAISQEVMERIACYLQRRAQTSQKEATRKGNSL